MFKKTFFGSVAIVSGFAIRDKRAGEEIYLGEFLLIFVFVFALGIFIEWSMIPYDWDKHKNKGKDKKNLS